MDLFTNAISQYIDYANEERIYLSKQMPARERLMRTDEDSFNEPHQVAKKKDSIL